MAYDNLTKQEVIAFCKKGTQFTTKDVEVMIATLKVSDLRPVCPNGIEVEDVISNTGLNHPGVVIRIDKQEVYYVLLTTQPKSSAILKKCNSRLFNGSFFTVSIGVTNMAAATQNVFAIYDNIGELKTVVKEIKDFYKSILGKQKTVIEPEPVSNS